MKQILVVILSLTALSGRAAYADPVKGAVSCNLGRDTVALVDWDDSPGQGYVNFTLFREGSDGKFQSYVGSAFSASDSLDFPSNYGGNYTVKINRVLGRCSIKSKASQ